MLLSCVRATTIRPTFYAWPTAAGRSVSSLISHDTSPRVLSTHPVPLAPAALADGTPETFLKFVTSPQRTPLLFSSRDSRPLGAPSSRATELLHGLRKGNDKLVEIELGRYDDTTPGAFHRVPMRLGQYLDWLESEGRGDGRIGDQQVYLAQWRGSDEVPGIADHVAPLPVLEYLLSSGSADLYQTSFFIGPNSAITPLHHDPYENLYHLHASSEPCTYAKHFVLLPPSLADAVRRADTHFSLRNTSPINLHLQHRIPSDEADSGFDVVADPSTPLHSLESISTSAFSCILREGETLFIPRGWWHRVENVSLIRSNGSPKRDAGWTAGIGWWFLLRKS